MDCVKILEGETFDENCVDILEKYRYVNYLGSGGFGDTFLVEYRENSYTIKVLKLGYIEEEEILNEIYILCELNKLEDDKISNNFTKLIQWIKCYRPGINKRIQLPNIKRIMTDIDNFSYYIIMEYSTNTLNKYLKEKSNITTLEYKYIIFQLIYGMAAGIYYLSLNHNDLRIDNILMNNVDYNRVYSINNVKFLIPYTEPVLKISDFGLSQLDNKFNTDFNALLQLMQDISHYLYLDEIEELIKPFTKLVEKITNNYQTLLTKTNINISNIYIDALLDDFFISVRGNDVNSLLYILI